MPSVCAENYAIWKHIIVARHIQLKSVHVHHARISENVRHPLHPHLYAAEKARC
jgi:hypothetical protein